MTLTVRLLGLAFASADALVEIDASGVVSFAMGAGAAPGQDAGAAWTKKRFLDILHDGQTVMAAVQATASGVRTPAMPILLAAGPDRVRRASLRAFVLPQLAMLGFACHVVYMAVLGLGSDLVEPRRRLRVPFAITMGSIVAIIVGSGFLPLPGLWLYSVYIGAIFLFILFFNLATFRLHKDSPQLIEPVVETALPSLKSRVSERDKDRPLIDRIHAVMEDERLYAQPGLTIGELAARVSMQEYRLRKLINQKLHYRNFNQYLNQYRIAEAARRLQSAEESQVPISTIALDVGYASLSSFNKAFKELHGVTPSIYRSRALA